MSIFSKKEEKASPKTVVGSDKNEVTYFSERNRDLNKFNTIYENGGLISQCIDVYSLFTLSAGYELEGPSRVKKQVEQWLYDINISELVDIAMTDSLIFGDGFQEMVYSRAGELLYLQPRDARNFTILTDKYGIVTGYKYKVDDKETILKPEQISHTRLIPTSNKYGVSLIFRCIDDILRDTKIMESTSISILRHGFPRFHIKVGKPGEEVPPEQMKVIAREFEELKEDQEIVTVADVDIETIDTNGVENVAEYSTFSTDRLLASMGVPAEVVGISQNTTVFGSDISVEMSAWLLKVRTYQEKVERVINRVIDFKTKSPGLVKLKFNTIIPAKDVDETAGDRGVIANPPIAPDVTKDPEE